MKYVADNINVSQLFKQTGALVFARQCLGISGASEGHDVYITHLSKVKEISK